MLPLEDLPVGSYGRAKGRSMLRCLRGHWSVNRPTADSRGVASPASLMSMEGISS